MSAVLRALKKAKGLGSGHNGTEHFIAQRSTAVILIILALYFLYAIVRLVGAHDYHHLIAWFANPFNSGMLIAFILAGFYHATLGVQVVIEDYVHLEKLKWLSLIAVRGLALICATTAVIAIIRLALAH